MAKAVTSLQVEVRTGETRLLVRHNFMRIILINIGIVSPLSWDYRLLDLITIVTMVILLSSVSRIRFDICVFAKTTIFIVTQTLWTRTMSAPCARILHV